VFAGGCALAEAEAVAADGAVADWQVAEQVASLIAKSLVIVERTAQGARCRLLETTKMFASEQLETSGEGTVVAERHARYFTDLFERAYAAWETTPDEDWLRLYAPELDNVRTAMTWALRDPEHAQIAIALGGATGRLWRELGIQNEAKLHLGQAVERIVDDTPAAGAARLLEWAAAFLYNADVPQALVLAWRSAGLYRQFGDRLNLAGVLGMLGFYYTRSGRHVEAKAFLDEAYDTLSASDHKKTLRSVISNSKFA